MSKKNIVKEQRARVQEYKNSPKGQMLEQLRSICIHQWAVKMALNGTLVYPENETLAKRCKPGQQFACVEKISPIQCESYLPTEAGWTMVSQFDWVPENELKILLLAQVCIEKHHPWAAKPTRILFFYNKEFAGWGMVAEFQLLSNDSKTLVNQLVFLRIYTWN